MRKSWISIAAAVLLLALTCTFWAQAETTHTAVADESSVTITVGAPEHEEVTLKICAAEASDPIFIDQKTADTQGAVFTVPLEQGEYSYRAYLSDTEEYVSGTFRIGPAPTSGTSAATGSTGDPENPSDPSAGQALGGVLTAGLLLLTALSALAALKLTKKEAK